MTRAASTDSLHATTIAVDGRGVLILGRSGSGKSELALKLIAMGAVLVADDITRLEAQDGQTVALAPRRMAGIIEARGVGLLRVPYLAQAPVVLVVDLDECETERLPQTRVIPLCGTPVPLIYGLEASHFAPAVLLMARGGRFE